MTQSQSITQIYNAIALHFHSDLFKIHLKIYSLIVAEILFANYDALATVIKQKNATFLK